MRFGINAHLCSTALSCRNAGISSYIRGLANEMGKQVEPDEMHMFLSSNNQEPFPSNCRQHHCATSTKNPIVRILWEQLVLPRIINKLKLDLFHSPMHVLPAVCGCRSIVSILDLSFIKYPETFDAAKRRYLTLFTSRAVKKADAVIAISESTKMDIVELFGVQPDTIHVTHLAPGPQFRLLHESDALDAVRNRYGLGKRTLLCLGTLEPRKNLPNLIRAFHIVSRTNAEVQLVIAGAEGWLFEDAYQLIQDLDLHERVRRTGYIPAEDLPAMYNCADAFVYPSIYEGFGLPPLEAMACGAPVITSNTSSLPEVVGDAGLQVDPGNVEQLASAMLQVLTDDNLRQELREKGLNRARLFSWEETARQTLNIYRNTLKNR